MIKVPKYKALQLVFLTILILISLANSTVHSQTDNLIFEKISLNDGFPSRCIDCVLQDHLGLLWFGTRNGLVKYDGNRFTHFKHDDSDSSTIIYRFVKSLVEDNYGNIWIGTTRGLSRLIRDENRIINYSANFIDSLKSIYVNRLHYDKNGNLWIGTFSQGIYLLAKDKIKKNLKSYNFEKIIIKSEIQGIEEINCIAENDSGIFVGTENGLIKIAHDPNNYTFFQFKPSINRIEENIISDLAFDKSNKLWIGTKAYGLASFDLNNNTFQFTSFLDKENKLLTNWVRALAVDKNGLIWCGMYGHSYQGGLVTYDPNLKIFNRYLSNPNLLTSIGPYKWFTNDLYIDDASIIWITTREGPIDRIIPEKNQVKFISIEQKNPLNQQDPLPYMIFNH